MKDSSGYPIDSDVLVEAERENGEVKIFAETERDYQCSNFSIDYSEYTLGSTIRIKFKRAQTPSPCLTSTGPAKATIDLGELEKEDYDLKFKLNGETTNGTLSTDPFSFELEDEGNVSEM